MTKIRAFAPATLSNLNCGFDVLGLALENPGDQVEIELHENSGLKILSIEGDQGHLPLDPLQNTASIAVQAYLDARKWYPGVNIRLYKGMPLGSGMGSSAASAVASVYAINCLHPKPLPLAELLPFLAESEKITSGSAHLDNAAPSLLGGLVLIQSYNPLILRSLPLPEDLYVLILHPDVEIPTRLSRRVLPREIPMSKAIQQWGNLAALVDCLHTKDWAGLKTCLQDVLVEPVRREFIPEFYALKELAQAIGFGISGSGPSMFSLYAQKEEALKRGQAMQKHLYAKGIQSQMYLGRMKNQGARII